MQHHADDFLLSIKNAIEADQLCLPSLPDVVSRIREECEKPGASAQSMADVLSTDPAISIRLIQVANSPLYSSCASVDNLQGAVTRLGMNMVKNLVISLAMKQVYKASTDVLEERFKELWLSSIKTAALCRLFAKQYTRLDAELAMLAGLTHNIGGLPILLMAEDDDILYKDPVKLKRIISRLQGKIGSYIFKFWNFPQTLIDVASECMNFSRQHSNSADYIDIVQVALVEGSIFTGLECPDDWSGINAFKKLGIDNSCNVLEIENNKIIFEQTESLFR